MSPPPAPRHTLLGVAAMMLVALCFAGMDITVRHTGALAPLLLLLWLRYAVQAVLMTAWLALDRRLAFRPDHPRFQALRGLLLLATSAMSFVGLQVMPVPEFTAIHLISPVLVTLLAAWLLKERVSRLRWALVAGCFVGALIVIRPGSGLFGWAVLFPLAGAACYASFQVLTSRLVGLDHPLTTHFWTGLTGAVVLLPVLWFAGIDAASAIAAMTPTLWALALLIGALGSFGHLLLIFALGTAPASTLMPFIYLQIGFAAGLSWLVFRQVPDSMGWLGMAVIAVCGAASAWLNLRAAPRRAVEVQE